MIVAMTVSKTLTTPLGALLAGPMQTLRNWPWFETLRTLRARFRDDRLGLTASSLTFTTLISLVPLLTVMLAVFTAFPMFSSFQAGLEKYFLQSLVPPNIAKPVLGTLTMFATKASRLGAFGLIALGFTAMALMLTIDRTLNAIWRVRKPRPIGQRVLLYWAAVTLGPLILGASLTLMSYALSASSGMVKQMSGGMSFSLSIAEFLVLGGAMSALYHYVPHAPVAWRHALAGGLFVSTGFEVARRSLGWYLTHMTSYSSIYGAFATVPIFLLWIYLGWVIVLLGAVIAAYAPSLKLNLVQHGRRPGQPFALGHDAAAVAAPSTSWFFGEGATGAFFDTFLLLANPSAQNAVVQVEYLRDGDGAVTRTYTVPANSRFSVYVDGEPGMAATAFGTRVTSSVPIVAERAMYWPGGFFDYYEGHDSAGATQTGSHWVLAEGEEAGPNQAHTFVLIANTSSTPVSVRVRTLPETGPAEASDLLQLV